MWKFKSNKYHVFQQKSKAQIALISCCVCNGRYFLKLRRKWYDTVVQKPKEKVCARFNVKKMRKLYIYIWWGVRRRRSKKKKELSSSFWCFSKMAEYVGEEDVCIRLKKFSCRLASIQVSRRRYRRKTLTRKGEHRADLFGQPAPHNFIVKSDSTDHRSKSDTHPISKN